MGAQGTAHQRLPSLVAPVAPRQESRQVRGRHGCIPILAEREKITFAMISQMAHRLARLTFKPNAWRFANTACMETLSRAYWLSFLREGRCSDDMIDGRIGHRDVRK